MIIPVDPDEFVISSCFDVEVDIGVCCLEFWPTSESEEPLHKLYIGGEQSYYRYEGDFGPVRIRPKGQWTGRITYYDQI